MNKPLLKDQLSIIVPVFNEEKHLPRLLTNLKALEVSVFVVDSGSTDETVAIAEQAGCATACGEWTSFSEKLNWAIRHTPHNTPWVMRVDADEWLTDELIAELKQFDFANCSSAGLYCGRRLYFLGEWMKHGGLYPYKVIRIFRPNLAQYEIRQVDEHLDLQGSSSVLKHDLCDEPLTSIAHWTRKHVNYAERECFQHWNSAQFKQSSWREMEGNPKIRRFLKEVFYERMPLFARPFLYFIYRYFLKFGFLDGKAGLVYHFLHAFWYRALIDSMIYEAQQTDGKYVLTKIKM